MVSKHILYCGLGVSACFFQEFSLYRSGYLYQMPLSRGWMQSNSVLFFIYFIGLGLDLAALMKIPLVSYFIISALHLVFLKFFHSRDQGLAFTSAERVGNLCIMLAVFIVTTTGGTQGETAAKGFTPDYFLIYGISSCLLLAVTRRLGFYSGKIILELALPATLVVFMVGVVKVAGFLVTSELIKDIEHSLMFPFAMGVWILAGIAGSLIRIYSKKHDLVVVYGAYLCWCVVFSLPVGFFFADCGVEYQAFNLACCILAAVVCIVGALFVTYQRVEYLKLSIEDKNVHRPPQPSRFEAPLPEDPNRLEFIIEDDNLMDAEIIDEDLLIKTIRNI